MMCSAARVPNRRFPLALLSVNPIERLPNYTTITALPLPVPRFIVKFSKDPSLYVKPSF